jgi:pimeloyl-ACP methyl ester carboxylesterase
MSAFRVISAAIVLTAAAVPSFADAPVETRFVTNGAAHLEVLSQGSGPLVILIPSLGRGAHDFDDLAAHIAAAGFQVARAEPRGIGASTGPMTGLTLHDLAGDAVAVIKAFGARQAFVIGHDDGNRVARTVAADDPDLVKAIILIGSGGKVKPDAEAVAALRATFDPTLPPAVHLHDVATAFFAPDHDPAVWKDGWYPATARMELAASEATPVSQWWTAGSAPVLVIQGRNDRIAPPQNAALLQQDIGARAQVDYVDDAGHALLPEHPARAAELVIAYLRKQK